MRIARSSTALAGVSLASTVALSASLLAHGCVRRARTEVEYVTVQEASTGGVVVVDAQGGAGGSSEGLPATAGSGAYVLVGADARSDGYGGDTPTSTPLPVLCLRPAGLPDPGHLGTADRTPGGSLRRRWSGAEVALTEPLAGWSLTSREVADQQCASRFGAGWRMAEFHDGGRGAGFDFWALGTQGDFATTRFWVAISDQQANPWSSDAAMTWRLLERR
jgi:hypothetical protein